MKKKKIDTRRQKVIQMHEVWSQGRQFPVIYLDQFAFYVLSLLGMLGNT